MENIIILACKEPISLMGFEYDKEIGLNSESYKELVEQIVKIDKSKLIKNSNIYVIKKGDK